MESDDRRLRRSIFERSGQRTILLSCPLMPPSDVWLEEEGAAAIPCLYDSLLFLEQRGEDEPRSWSAMSSANESPGAEPPLQSELGGEFDGRTTAVVGGVRRGSVPSPRCDVVGALSSREGRRSFRNCPGFRRRGGAWTRSKN